MRQRGAAAIEFAIILSLLFIPLLFGMMEWGYYFFVDNLTNQAAREGARAATTIAGRCGQAGAGQAEAEGTRVARDTMRIIGFDGYSTITVTCLSAAPLSNPTWQVNVAVDFPTLTGFSVGLPRSATAGNAMARAQAVMRGTP